jgi:ketohexokinase
MRLNESTSEADAHDRVGPSRRRILGVGVATLDLIHTVDTYPSEDAEVRATRQRQTCGGNCANTLTVLADLGHDCTWAGTLAKDEGAGFISAALTARGIDCTLAVRHPGGTTPTSHITLSRATGSRTIVHYRDLPELDAAAFAGVPLDRLDWVHFEGRNPSETARMLERIRRDSPTLPISLELEKSRPGSEALLRGPDLLLISRAFALADGDLATAADPRAWLTAMLGRTDARTLVLGWGDQGAWLLERGDSPQRIPARPPAQVLDTLGAGDTLNAGMIDGLLRGLCPTDALSRAVALAGLKCGREGFDGLGEAARRLGNAHGRSLNDATTAQGCLQQAAQQTPRC